jgi:geranyl-CoA carboxylase alpha subunit
MVFSKVLVANRGEIAVRVLRGAQALGLRTVAIYSSADAGAPHVALADEAVLIGPPPPRESYLAIDKVVAAAKTTGADAVHPGYGFLSENAAFARACAESGLVFVGPPADAIELMGNKRAAKVAMIAAGVPCVPGYLGDADDHDALRAAARDIGYPLMVKAAAGGGGRGMRLVAAEADLPNALRAAAAEALSAFGSGELILEKALVGPRHVEVQVFADRHGNCIHLGERDCSVQRRHQKVVEECPSPAVDAPLREAMGSAAVAAARACNYVGAGTVEFLLGADRQFYFLEMNTRLQVEHPVTELCTGVDLVAWQFRVARGEKLPLAQSEVRLRGHAIEVRVYAEDPARGFMPQTGTLARWREPAGVRVDAGFVEGQEVSPHYDAMLAKLIAHGDTRDDARRKLAGALRELTVLGVMSNKELLLAICEHPRFAEGAATTAFIGDDMSGHPALAANRPASLTQMAAAATARLYAFAGGLAEDDGFIGWRSAGPAWSTAVLATAADERTLQISRKGRGEHGPLFVVTEEAPGDLPGTSVELEVVRCAGGELAFVSGGVRRNLRFAFAGDSIWLDDGERVERFEDVTYRPAQAATALGSGHLSAPLDGKVTGVFVKVGDAVELGQLVMVIEAMKMEHRIEADVAGLVKELAVSAGQQVKARQPLAVVGGAS